MIVLVDLDGTLVDRAAAFGAWARRFVAAHGGGDDDVRWLLELDADGYAPRADVAAALRQRLHLGVDVRRLVERLLFEHVDDVRAFPGVVEELDALRTGAGVAVVVTNGTVAQQQRKLRVSGLADRVDDVVVSEAVGAKKPDPAIFSEAMARAVRLGGSGPAWMVGDHPVADVGGGQAAGLLTGWVSGGRPWPGGPPPDLVAEGTAEVLAAVRAHERPRDVPASRSGTSGAGPQRWSEEQRRDTGERDDEQPDAEPSGVGDQPDHRG